MNFVRPSTFRAAATVVAFGALAGFADAALAQQAPPTRAEALAACDGIKDVAKFVGCNERALDKRIAAGQQQIKANIARGAAADARAAEARARGAAADVRIKTARAEGIAARTATACMEALGLEIAKAKAIAPLTPEQKKNFSARIDACDAN